MAPPLDKKNQKPAWEPPPLDWRKFDDPCKNEPEPLTQVPKVFGDYWYEPMGKPTRIQRRLAKNLARALGLALPT